MMAVTLENRVKETRALGLNYIGCSIHLAWQVLEPGWPQSPTFFKQKLQLLDVICHQFVVGQLLVSPIFYPAGGHYIHLLPAER